MEQGKDCLYHFTDSIDVVKNILADKFYGSYSRETFRWRNETTPFFVPTICFADIKHDKVFEYKSYGNYCIGLSKEWAVRNKLNPVLYIEKNSSVSDVLVKSLFGALGGIRKLQQEVINVQRLADIAKLTKKPEQAIRARKATEQLRHEMEAYQFTIYSIYYTKHYQDDLELKTGEVLKNYRFYDEREWRYVPEFDCAVCELKTSEEEYKKWRGEGPKPRLANVSLDFDPSDIQYLFVSNQEDVKNLIEWIETLKKEGLTDDDKKILIKKILSFN
jgi:hypothetical protein